MAGWAEDVREVCNMTHTTHIRSLLLRSKGGDLARFILSVHAVNIWPIDNVLELVRVTNAEDWMVRAAALLDVKDGVFGTLKGGIR